MFSPCRVNQILLDLPSLHDCYWFQSTYQLMLTLSLFCLCHKPSTEFQHLFYIDSRIVEYPMMLYQHCLELCMRSAFPRCLIIFYIRRFNLDQPLFLFSLLSFEPSFCGPLPFSTPHLFGNPLKIPQLPF